MLELDPLHWGLLIVTGGVTGLCLGLFGRAGSLVITPALLIVLPACGISAAEAPRIAVASAVAVLIPLGIAQAEGGLSRKAVDWDLFLLLAPSVVSGAVAAAIFADGLDGRIHVLVFAGIAGVFALGVMRGARHQGAPAVLHAPQAILLMLKTMAAGALCALAGISPALLAAGPAGKVLGPERAKATAQALTLPFALAAAGGYLLQPPPSACGQGCAGAVFLPCLAAAGMSAILAAPLGLRLRAWLPPRRLGGALPAIVLASLCLAAFSSQPLLTLAEEAGVAAAEYVLGPLCEPPPAPGKVVLQSPENAPVRLGEVPLKAAAR